MGMSQQNLVFYAINITHKQCDLIFNFRKIENKTNNKATAKQRESQWCVDKTENKQTIEEITVSPLVLWDGGHNLETDRRARSNVRNKIVSKCTQQIKTKLNEMEKNLWKK